MSKINLPNKLTICRIILVPPMVFLMLSDFRFAPVLSLVIFAVASVTDYLDGKIARSRALITNFGKFLDPMADKILVLSTLICFQQKGLCSPWVVVIVAFREFMISSMRIVAASQQIVIAAGKSGKVKTASQMFSMVAVLVLLSVKSIWINLDIPIEFISNILMWLTAVIVIYSGADYLWHNRKLIDPRE